MVRPYALALSLLLSPSLATAADAEVERWYRELVSLVAAGNFEAVVSRVHPSGFITGDLFVKKDQVVRELKDPASDRRKRLEASFTEENRKMCREVGISFLQPKAFLAMTQGKYSVHIQTDFKPILLVSANSEVKLNDNTVCSLSLFPVEVQKLENGKLYALGTP